MGLLLSKPENSKSTLVKSTVLEAWEWNSPGGVKIDTKEQILESWTAADLYFCFKTSQKQQLLSFLKVFRVKDHSKWGRGGGKSKILANLGEHVQECRTAMLKKPDFCYKKS